MPGGVGDYCARLIQALGERNNKALDLAVLTIRDGALSLLDAPGTEYSRVSHARNMHSWGWPVLGAVSEVVGSWKPDILHIQYQTGAYAMHPAINLLPAFLRRIGPCPALVVTAHDLLLPYLAPKMSWLREWVTFRLMADCKAVIVTNNEDMLRIRGAPRSADTSPGAGLAVYCAQRRLPAHVQVQMIPIGANIDVAPPHDYQRELWRQKLGADANTVLLAYFGLISHSKGLDTILDALEQLPAHVRLLVIGGESASQDQAYAESLRARMQSNSLQQRVHITGHCSAEDVSAYLLAADMAVLPFKDGASFRRGSLLAALAHGLPVITTYPRNIIATDPQLVDGKNAILVPTGDAAAIAAAVCRLALEPVEHGLLAQAAKSLAASFSWHDIAEQHMHVYAQLTKL